MTTRRATTRHCADHTRYTAGCDGCQTVTRRYAKARQLRRIHSGRIDPTGTIRRLRALAHMGWSARQLGHLVGCSQQKVSHWQAGSVQYVFAATAMKIARLYDELSVVDGGNGRARTRATAHRWAAPQAWVGVDIDNPDARPLTARELAQREAAYIDEAAVERRLAGDRVPLTNAERLEVVRRAHGNGWNDAQTERATGIDARQVIRDRQRLGLAANYWQDVERKDGAA